MDGASFSGHHDKVAEVSAGLSLRMIPCEDFQQSWCSRLRSLDALSTGGPLGIC